MANKPLRSIKFPGLDDTYNVLQSDWDQNDENQLDYVKNRPFYKKNIIDISWDGNTEGLETIEGFPFFKVSDSVPDVTNIIGATIEFLNDGETLIFDVTSNYIMEGENCVSISEFIVLSYGNSTLDGLVFPTRGVWFISDSGNFTKSFKKIELKTFDAEFLPEIPAEKLPEIPAEKLPSLNTMKIIELSGDITGSIGESTQPSFVVNNYSYSEMTEIFNSGNFTFMDSNGLLVRPIMCKKEASGALSAWIFVYSAVNGAFVVANLLCSSGKTWFYRNSYKIISTTN